MAHETINDDAAAEIAARFVHARRAARALDAFPGDVPADLDAAYRCQDAAIAQWPARVRGWKVGWIAPDQRLTDADERLLGPVFDDGLRCSGGDTEFDVAVFAGGFAAIESEFVVRLGADAPADQFEWTPAQARALASALHIGIETAGSPLATINALGPRVIVSDFGNNAGLIIGAEIPGGLERDPATIGVATYIDDEQVGTGTAASVAGGPWAALAFALARSARRGRPLRAGDWITTGAATGIHDIRAGQTARADFGPLGVLRCRARARTAEAAA